MSGGKIALLVVGIIFLVGALTLLAFGGGLMWLTKAIENDNGFLTTRTTHLQKNSYAIVTEPIDIAWDIDLADSPWGPGDFVTFKVEGENEDASKGVFIGIARESDVVAYLRNVRYDEIIDWSSDPFDDAEVKYQVHAGSSTPVAPTSQDFWETSVYGQDRQTLEWTPVTGKWVLVFMNEDGSAGIDVSGIIGAKVPWLFWAGLGLLLTGIVALVGGVIMVYFAARRPNQPIVQVQDAAQ